MIFGLGAGLLWALETVVLSMILSADVFVKSKEIVYLAPFISAFLNDTISGIWLWIFRKSRNGYQKESVKKALKTSKGKVLILSGLFGGPLGMSCYLLSIKSAGASNTAVISAIYPAIGAMIAWIFLKDKLSWKQLFGVFLCVLGSIKMIGAPIGGEGNTGLLIFAFACAFFWAMEGVLSSYAMKSGEISFEIALQIRQGTSFLCYAVIFLPLLRGWGLTFEILTSKNISFFFITSFLEIGSYLLYYKIIHMLGTAKAMSLNVTYILWSVIFSIIFLKDIPQIYELISIGILTAGVLFVVLNAPKVRSNELYKKNEYPICNIKEFH